MAILFSETFSGQGDIDGKAPDIGDPGGHAWGAPAGYDGCTVVQTGGYATNSVPSSINGSAAAFAEMSGYGPLDNYTLAFDILTGADMSIGLGLAAYAFEINLSSDNGEYSISLAMSLEADESAGWQVTMYGDDSIESACVPVTALANTSYPCALSYSAGVQTFVGLGVSVMLDKTEFLQGVHSPFQLSFSLARDTRVGSIALMTLEDADPQAKAAAPSVLAAPRVRAIPVAAVVCAIESMLSLPSMFVSAITVAMSAAPGIMQASSALATFTPNPMCLSAAPSMLQGGSAIALHDFTGQIGDATTLFVMDLLTPGGTVRIPISSWQATLQTGGSNYLQCVIPACTIWTSAINSATNFVIYRRAELQNGSAIEYEMARASAQPQYDRGPMRHTCTLSGYSQAFATSEVPLAIYDRALGGIRSISSGSSYRVRCAVDWLLRPGHRAFVEGAPFIVKFINYYAPSGFDSYMDVGG